MGNENMFIAAAVWLTGMLGFFTFLFWYSKNETFRKLWLLGAFGCMLVSMEMLRRGWQNVVVMYELADLVEILIGIFVSGIILISLGLMVGVMMDTFKYIQASVTGRRHDEKD